MPRVWEDNEMTDEGKGKQHAQEDTQDWRQKLSTAPCTSFFLHLYIFRH